MATSDSPLSVPNVTLAVARGAAASLTLVGAGFGSKPLGLDYLETFEASATGAVSASVGSISVSNDAGMSVSDAGARTGSKCLRQDYSLNGFPKPYKSLSGTKDKAYQCAWFKWAGSVASDTVWKFARFGGNAVYSGVPHFSDSYTSNGANTPTGFGTEIVTSDGLTGFAANATEKASSLSSLFTADTWHFYELEAYAGTVDGNDAFFEVRLDGQTTIRFAAVKYLTTANSTLFEWAMPPLNSQDQAPDIVALMDEYYVDESRARVLITDAPVYANSTNWAVQKITNWSDTEIQAEKRQGALQAGTNYVHVWNDAGVKVIDGQEVTL